MNNSVDIKTIITNWVKINSQIKDKHKELLLLKRDIKTVNEQLVNFMKTNDIDEFDLSKGKIVYTKSKVKSALSKKHLIDCLGKFYKNDNEMVDELTKYIMDSRQEKIKEDIKHKD